MENSIGKETLFFLLYFFFNQRDFIPFGTQMSSQGLKSEKAKLMCPFVQ